MITIKSFCFNSFEENTYVLSDSSLECIIIDPGCHMEEEEKELTDYISENNFRPVRLINTHCHIDHILGNSFIARRYQLKLEANENELPVLSASGYVSQMYQIQLNPSPEIENFINEGDLVKFGNSVLEVLFTPGHSPGSLTFFAREDKFIISGDVLFERSIGRTDLPGGNHETLIASIITKILPLGDDITVYSGHGNSTTVGAEKRLNPFLREHLQH
ncbi:MAG: MBL fold metallo-hydrolase [Bacteroidota bacterium]|nr:MBL fold metallo-hydrolase [Bacteroidota bacterium]